MQTLAALLDDLVALGPDRPALTVGATTLSFGDLDRRSRQVAAAMAAYGVAPGDRVAVVARNGPAYFELLFGAARAGAVLVGVNWRLAPAEVAAVLDDAAPAFVVVEEAQRRLVEGVPDKQLVVLGAGYEEWLAADHPAVTTSPQPDDVVLQLYSSGTTGRPKGARLTHANLLFTPRMGRESYAMGPESVNLLVSPLFHIGGIGYAMTALGQGAHTVLVVDVEPGLVLETIAEHRVTHAFLVPAVVQMLVSHPRVAEIDLSSLEVIAYGGAPMTEALLRRAMDTLRCGFLGVYGMTETAGSVTALPPADHDPGGPRAGLLRSIGRTLPWHDVEVHDVLTGEPSPPGEVGEIWVRSGQNTPGYWGLPEETASTLVDGGWLRTGDAAYADEDGYLFLHDRIKDMVISGGENVYPAEVENAVAGHPAVAEVAVIGVPSPRWGETVKAVVVLAEDATATPEELIAWTRDRLAHYKCPTSVDFVEVLPRNASGKILKKDLRAPFWVAT